MGSPFKIPGKRRTKVGWEEYKREAEKSAKRRQPGRVPANDHRLGPEDSGLVWPCPDDKRCQHVRKGGDRCKRYAVKGAQYCYGHGGPRQVPSHPVNGRLWLSGAIHQEDRHRQDREWFVRQPVREREAARDICAAHGVMRTPTNCRKVMEAWRLDDGGKAYRRLLRIWKAQAHQRDRQREKTEEERDKPEGQGG